MIARCWWALVRFGFRLLYNELALTYDPVSRLVSLGHWRAWQRAALHYVAAGPGDIVLELAYGTGSLHLDLHAWGYRAVGVDLSPYMARIAARKLRRHGLRLTLARGDAAALPFPGAVFASVVSTFPTPFIFEPQTLREIHRVLCPGGRLVVVINGRLTGRGLPARLVELAYAVTGQRGAVPVEAILARFRAAGLPAEWITRVASGGEVALIVAEKIEAYAA